MKILRRPAKRGEMMVETIFVIRKRRRSRYDCG